MADPEYGYEFVVYLTAESGVRYLTNPAWIRIVGELMEEPLTIAQLSDRLGLPRSTVQSGVGRMTSLDMLWSVRSSRDARKVIHMTRCVPLIRSVEVWEGDDSLRRSAIRSLMRRTGIPPYEILLLMMVMLRSRGLDVGPMFLEAGIAVGDMLAPLVPYDDPVSIARGIANALAPGCSLDVHVSERTGVTLSVDFDDFPPMPISLLTGTILAVIQSKTGIELSARVIISLSDDVRSARVRTVPFRTGDEVGQLRPMLRDDGRMGSTGAEFSIYMGPNGPLLVANQPMVAVLDALSEGDSTVSGLSVVTGLSEVTVRSALHRLESVGAAVSDLGSGTLTYSTPGYRVMHFPSTTGSPVYRPVAAASDPVSDFRVGVFRHMMWAGGLFGLGASDLARVIGKTVAKADLEMSPGITAQQFVDRVASSHTAKGLELSVDTYIPLHLTYRQGADSDELAYQMTVYLESLLDEALTIITGHRYPVSVEVDHSRRTV